MDHKSCLSTLCILCLDLASADGDRLCKPWDLNVGFGSKNKDVVVVQLLSCIQLSVTPWTAACQACLSFTISWSLLKFLFIESVILANHTLPPTFPFAFSLSHFQGLFQWVGSSHQVAKLLELQASAPVLPMNIHSGLVSFRADWFDLLAVQGTLKGLLQY